MSRKLTASDQSARHASRDRRLVFEGQRVRLGKRPSAAVRALRDAIECGKRYLEAREK